MKVSVTIAAILIFINDVTATSVLIADHKTNLMIELTDTAPFCNIYTEKATIRDMVLACEKSQFRVLPIEALSKLREMCENTKIATRLGTDEPAPTISKITSLACILLGTKWCGPGTVAKDENDLGSSAQEDSCCRTHDNCPNNLKAGECKQGVCNDSSFTQSHCDCDERFKKCLEESASETANAIGAIFYNIVKVVCFKERTTRSQRASDGNSTMPQLEFQNAPKYMPGSTKPTFSCKEKTAYIFNKVVKFLHI